MYLPRTPEPDNPDRPLTDQDYPLQEDSPVEPGVSTIHIQ